MHPRILLFAIATAFWGYGVIRFINLPPVLANRGKLKRWTWVVVLCALGALIGLVLDQDRLQSKAALGLLLVPVLAWIDDRTVYKQQRIGYWFFFVICFFEIYTVFVVAAVVRFALDHLPRF